MRNILQSDTSSICFSVALAPLERRACFRTLKDKKGMHVIIVLYYALPKWYVQVVVLHELIYWLAVTRPTIHVNSAVVYGENVAMLNCPHFALKALPSSAY